MKSRDSEKFIVRLPDGLRDKIRTEAALNLRSMNGEIVFQLQQIYRAVKNEKGDASA